MRVIFKKYNIMKFPDFFENPTKFITFVIIFFCSVATIIYLWAMYQAYFAN